MNVWTIFHHNPSNSCWDVSVWTKWRTWLKTVSLSWAACICWVFFSPLFLLLFLPLFPSFFPSLLPLLASSCPFLLSCSLFLSCSYFFLLFTCYSFLLLYFRLSIFFLLLFFVHFFYSLWVFLSFFTSVPFFLSFLSFLDKQQGNSILFLFKISDGAFRCCGNLGFLWPDSQVKNIKK